MELGSDTFNEKFPALFVEVPWEVPLTITETPAKASPAGPVTLPVIMLLCANPFTVTYMRHISAITLANNGVAVFLCISVFMAINLSFGLSKKDMKQRW